MARPRFHLGRAGLLVLGMVAGLVITLLLVYSYIQNARTRVVSEQVRIALGLPEQAFELEKVEADGSLRIVLRDVAFLDRNRDTILSAPIARARLIARTLNGGTIVFDQGEIIRPYLRLQRDAKGEWNALQIFAVEAAGKPVAGEETKARSFDFRGIRLVDGRARIVTPTTAPVRPQPRYVPGRPPETVRYAGQWLSVHTISDLNANLALVRVKAAGGWRVEIGSATAAVSNPDTRIEALAGVLDQDANQNLRFEIREFRTPHSRFDGAGTMNLAGATPRYDLRVRAHPLDFRDLYGMGFAVPREGTASFGLAMETLPGNRTRWTVTDASVAVLDSRASGRLTAITAPGREPVFTDTRLRLDPLRLRDLETLGFVDKLPIAGDVTGTVASVDDVSPSAGALRVDLVSTFTARSAADAPSSTVAARGLVRIGGAAGFRMDGLQVTAEPLNLATLAPLYPAQASLLRGIVRGGATLTGTMKEVRIEGGDLAYAVGNAPETRLRAINGTLTLSPSIRYDIGMRAEPLALATLTALFPQLPFRSATVAGPIHVSGTPENVAFDVDLDGSAGGIAMKGTLGLGGRVPTFDVSGRVSAFRAAVLVQGAPSAAGEVTGTFSANGNTEAFRFNVDLRQQLGRFTLGGTIRRPPGVPMAFDVAGRVDNFQVGVLVGRPELFPSPLSGPIRLSGGGGQPYRFDVDLRDAANLQAFAINGWYAPGPVPRYSIRGAVAGLDLAALPGLSAFPHTRLSGTILLEGQGTTTETFRGRAEFTATPGSTVGGIALSAATVKLTSDGGVLQVDTFLFAGRGFRAEARGSVGLTRNAGPLTFSLNAPNLALLRPFVPGSDTLPDLAGSVALSGTMQGTIKNPSLGLAGQARGFRYGTYAAGLLTFSFTGAKAGTGWTGEARLNGNDLQYGTLRLQALDLSTNIRPGAAAFSFSARRDAQTDLAAAGTLQLDGLSPQGADLDALTLRLSGTEWRLAQRAHVGWTAERGLEVRDLLLRRTGPGAEGMIAANGVLPPAGAANFRVQARGIDLEEMRRIFPSIPQAAGVLALDATIEGQVTDPRLHIDARVDSLVYGGVRADSVQLRAEYAAGRMQVNGGVRVGGREIVNAVASVPMRLSLGGIVPGLSILRDQPLSATLTADSVPLGLVTQSLPAFLADGAGVMRARVVVGGTPAHPTVNGDAVLQDGELTVTRLGAHWTRMNGRLSMHGDTIRVDSLTAHSGNDGRALINGTLLLDDATQPKVDLAVWLDDFQVADSRELAKIQSRARIRLSGRVPQVVVTGQLELEDGTIYIPSLNATAEADIVDADVGALGADTVSAPSAAQALMGAFVPRELKIVVGESVWLQSPDARIQIAGNLVVDRPPGSPATLIYGELDALRGSYTVEFGPFRRQFDIVQGAVRFYNTPELNPSLDITAAYRVRGGTTDQPLDVLVHLTGTLQQPRVELSTNNRVPLSQSELASLLLFGRTSDQAGGLPEELLSGLVVQEAVANFIVGQIESALVNTGFVDYVRVRTTTSTGTAAAGAAPFGLGFLGALTVELGKEIVSNVYLTGEIVNVTSQPQLGVGVDWQISPTLSLRAAWEPVTRDPLVRNLFRLKRQVTVDIRRRWEYGRPKARPGPLPRRPPDEAPPAQPTTPSGQPPPTTPGGGGGGGASKDDDDDG